MRPLHWIGGTVVLAGVLLLAVSLLPDPAQGGVGDGGAIPDRLRPQGHVYTGHGSEPAALNPFTTRSPEARRYVLAFTHDTLLDSDPRTGELRPALASAWEWHADGMGFTLTLRADVVFADGRPVTGRDVLFTWEVCRTEGEILGSMGQGMNLVRDAELLPGDPERIRVRLKEPYFAALRAVTESWIVAQRSFFLQQVAERAPDPESLPLPGDPDFGHLLAEVHGSGPGSGPYRLDRWRPSRDILLTRNERSWRRAAYPACWNLAGIRLRFLDQAGLFGALMQREIDWYSLPDTAAVLEEEPDLRRDYRRLVYDSALLGPFMILWNCRRPALANPDVRRALAMLFDRESMAKLQGDAKPAVSVFKKGTPEHPEDLAPFPFDPAAAREMLEEAGYGADRTLRLRILAPAPAPPIFEQALALTADAGRDAGVEILPEMVDGGALEKAKDDGDWDGMFYLMNHRTWVDPYALFHSDSKANEMGYSSPAVDELVEQARVETDRERRAELYRRFAHIVHEEQPVALLVQPLVSILFYRHIRDAEPGPFGLSPERFWVPAEHQREL